MRHFTINWYKNDLTYGLLLGWQILFDNLLLKYSYFVIVEMFCSSFVSANVPGMFFVSQLFSIQTIEFMWSHVLESAVEPGLLAALHLRFSSFFMI